MDDEGTLDEVRPTKRVLGDLFTTDKGIRDRRRNSETKIEDNLKVEERFPRVRVRSDGEWGRWGCLGIQVHKWVGKELVHHP